MLNEYISMKLNGQNTDSTLIMVLLLSPELVYPRYLIELNILDYRSYLS